MTSKITLEVGGHTGTAELIWKPASKYGLAHYEAFITVPYQDSRYEHLHIYKELDREYAMTLSRCILESALQDCMLCG